MRRPLYERYGEKKPAGVCMLTNTFGLAIYEPDDDDKYDCDFIAAWSNGENLWNFHRHKVYYSGYDRPYIRKGNMRIYLDNVMRV